MGNLQPDTMAGADSSLAQKMAGKQLVLSCCLLFVAVACVFLPTLRYDFINCDDDLLVTENLHTQAGLSWATVKWACGNGVAANWHPLTCLSHALDCQLYGLQPWGHHLTNVLLHALSTVLLFLVLRKATGAAIRSLFVALLFGLHPLRVESVAWVAERKDVLGMAFWLLTTAAYLQFVEHQAKGQNANRRLWYGLTLLCFCLGLMSKPVLVTLPCVLFLLDYWPLERLTRETVRRLVLEKLPLVLCAAAVCFITVKTQTDASNIPTTASLPMSSRVANALVSYCRYIGKLFWPENLAMPYPQQHWPLATVALAAVLLVALSAVAFGMRRRWPFLCVGWLWFVGTLVPVIGLVQVGSQAMADRYCYIPSIGLLIAMVWLVHRLCSAGAGMVRLAALAGALSVVGCVAVTVHQLQFWENSERVWRRALEVTKDNCLADMGLARTLCDQEQFKAALPLFQRALALAPHFPDARLGLGLCQQRLGHLDEAIAEFRQAVFLRPDNADGLLNLGAALEQKGLHEEALQRFQQARRLKADDAASENNLGVMFARQGRWDQAIAHFEQAVGLNPKDAQAEYNLGLAWEKKGSGTNAIAHYRKALELEPDYAQAQVSLANALRDQGAWEEALARYRAVLRLTPSYVPAAYEMGQVLLKLGRRAEAAAAFQEVLRVQPGNPQAVEQLRLMSTNANR